MSEQDVQKEIPDLTQMSEDEWRKAEEAQANVIKDLMDNPDLTKIASFVAYLLSKDDANEQQSIITNGLISTILDALQKKGIFDDFDFQTEFENNVKTINEERLQQFQSLADSLKDVK